MQPDLSGSHLRAVTDADDDDYNAGRHSTATGATYRIINRLRPLHRNSCSVKVSGCRFYFRRWYSGRYMYSVLIAVRLFLRLNLRVDLHKIWGIGRLWTREHLIKFWRVIGQICGQHTCCSPVTTCSVADVYALCGVPLECHRLLFYPLAIMAQLYYLNGRKTSEKAVKLYI